MVVLFLSYRISIPSYAKWQWACRALSCRHAIARRQYNILPVSGFE